MINSNNAYQYETSPRKLQPASNPKTRKKVSTSTKSKSNKQSVKTDNTKNNAKLKKNKKNKARAVLYVTIGFIILFTISYRNSLINESFNEKESLKKELNSLKKSNEQLQVGIENALNLNTIEQEAKERSGMQKLANNQKVYVNLEKKDYVQSATEEVIIEDNSSWFQKIIKGFTKTIK